MSLDDIFESQTKENAKKEPSDSKKNRKGSQVNLKFACTVANLLPYEFREEKPHMLPSSFLVPACINGIPGVLEVEEGIHYIPNPLIDEGKPGSSIKQTTMPNEMARSIVDDFSTSHIALSTDAGPGLFWVTGRHTGKEILEDFPDLVDEYTKKQLRWFRNLCALASADWNKNHNMLAVSDLQRMAGRTLGVQEPWVEMAVTETVACPMCQSTINPNAIVCMSCKYILKPELYKRESFANV